MLPPHLRNHRILLASKSPRRHQLLKGLEIDFEIVSREVEEVFPPELTREAIPRYLSALKAAPWQDELQANEMVITSDTIVWLNDGMLGKPQDRGEAISMIQALSGNTHTVITGVTLKTKDKEVTFHEETKVHFNTLSPAEIDHYIDTHQPFDKAGSYGIQEWIGYIGIRGIEGCFFNVMGLPLHHLYRQLQDF